MREWGVGDWYHYARYWCETWPEILQRVSDEREDWSCTRRTIEVELFEQHPDGHWAGGGIGARSVTQMQPLSAAVMSKKECQDVGSP